MVGEFHHESRVSKPVLEVLRQPLSGDQSLAPRTGARLPTVSEGLSLTGGLWAHPLLPTVMGPGLSHWPGLQHLAWTNGKSKGMVHRSRRQDLDRERFRE